MLLAGHLDTVPAQDNRPGRIDGGRVHGLGASDMKGALAVMLELALAGAPVRACSSVARSCRCPESALTPLLAREPIAAELVVMMEPTRARCTRGCLGNVNATWTFHGRSGHSARPWTADNAIEHAAVGLLALAAHPPVPHAFDGLEFVEVACVTRIAGGFASNVIPDRVDCLVNFRYAPGRSASGAEARLAELCAGHGTLTIDSNAPSGPVAAGHRGRRAGGGGPRPRAEAGVDAGRRVRARGSARGQLRAGRARPGAPARRVGRDRHAGARLRRPGAVRG